jgi:hypothetical protein
MVALGMVVLGLVPIFSLLSSIPVSTKYYASGSETLKISVMKRKKKFEKLSSVAHNMD